MNLKPRGIASTCLCIGTAALWSVSVATATPPSAIPPQTVSLTPNNPRLGDEMKLVIDLPYYGSEVLPLHVTYNLPSDCEVMSSDLPVQRGSDGNPHKIEWSGLHNKSVKWVVKFKFKQEGYFHIYGQTAVRRDDPKALDSAAIQFIKRLPSSKGWPENRIAREARNQRTLDAFDLFYPIKPESYFVLVGSGYPGRIEEWDFGTPWKRIKHWWKLKREWHGD